MKEDKTITNIYGCREAGLIFNSNMRYFITQQNKFFYARIAWVDPRTSEPKVSALRFPYSLN